MTDIDVTADLGTVAGSTQNGAERYERLADATSKIRGRTAVGKPRPAGHLAPAEEPAFALWRTRGPRPAAACG